MMNSAPLLDVQGLSIRYPQGYELLPSSFAFAGGTTNAFLGANGAGKSTLFQLLSANLHASAGQIKLAGKLLAPEQYALKRAIGYLPQNLQLPPWITGIELLRYAANLYGIDAGPKRVEELLSYWDCREFATLALAACSHGMQKRIALALTFIHDPTFAILDEPFSGLDLYHTKALEEEISRREKLGKLTILSTHIIPYVVELCSSATIIKGGMVTSIADWKILSATEKAKKIASYFF
jgi:ABC-type multidrug transport system ATPase subunit